MKSIHTEIEINASADKVWSVLTDFSAYPQWNPFIKTISGEKKEGSKWKVVLQLPDSRPMTFKPVCLVFREKAEFRWQGKLFVPGIFDGEHCFRLKEIGPSKTKFVQSENFKGFLLTMMWKRMHGKTLQAFEQMNSRLKARAEAM